MIATRVEDLVEPVAGDIRRMAAQAEAERRMPDELLQSLMEAGLFSIYTPKQFGGLDLPLPEALRVVEEVSRHDGSTGWTVALGVVNSLFTSVLPDESARRVLGNGSVLICGSPAMSVQAVPVEGGYRLSGRWGFNSGAPNASWVAIPAPIFEGGAPRMGEGGPELVFCFFPRSEAADHRHLACHRLARERHPGPVRRQPLCAGGDDRRLLDACRPATGA